MCDSNSNHILEYLVVREYYYPTQYHLLVIKQEKGRLLWLRNDLGGGYGSHKLKGWYISYIDPIVWSKSVHNILTNWNYKYYNPCCDGGGCDIDYLFNGDSQFRITMSNAAPSNYEQFEDLLYQLMRNSRPADS